MGAYADVLEGVSGPWTRGRAEVVIVPRVEDGGFDLTATDATEGVKVVGMDFGGDVYEMAKQARRAVRALMALADEPSDDAVMQFVSRYGLIYGLTGQRYLFETSDRDQYVAWCRQTGRRDDGDFLMWRVMEWDNNRWGRAVRTYEPHHLEREPLALFIWAGQQLRKVEQELSAGDLTREMAWWLDNQMMTLHLRYVGAPRRLMIVAQTLLSYLAAQVVLDVHGWRPEITACEECGATLPVEKHGRQRFCSMQCQERNKKRRQRAQKRQQATATGVANNVAE